MRRYSRNILQWRKMETKNANPTHWRLLLLKQNFSCMETCCAKIKLQKLNFGQKALLMG